MGAGRGHQLLHSDAFSAELEALGLDSSLFGAAGIPAPIFQALVPRRAGVFDENAHTFGTSIEPASFTRASNALYRDAAGAWAVAGANAIRAEHDASGNFLGYLFEPASTNEFLNSAAAVTQDISLGTGTFTCSVHGTGSVTSSDGTGTASGHGAATDGSPVTITVSGAGTITYTVSGAPTYVQVEELPVPTSPIITAGASATRALDALSWTQGYSAVEDAAGTVMVDWVPQFAETEPPAASGIIQFAALHTASALLGYSAHPAGNRITTHDGSGQTFLNLAVPIVSGTLYRVVYAWAGSAARIGCSVARGAFAFSAGSYDGAQARNLSALALNRHAGLTYPSCIKNVRIWNRAISNTDIGRLFR